MEHLVTREVRQVGDARELVYHTSMRSSTAPQLSFTDVRIALQDVFGNDFDALTCSRLKGRGGEARGGGGGCC
jgi:hypothetical protein